MRKIINISQNVEPVGGSDIYFHRLTELLRFNEYFVEEFASSKDKEYSDLPYSVDFDNPNLSTLFKYLYNNEARVKLASKLDKNKFDIAHLHIYYGKLTSSIIGELKNRHIPIVQTLHEYKLVCPTYKMYDGNQNCFTCTGNNFYKALTKSCNRGSFSRTAFSVLESYVSLFLGSQSKIDHFVTVSDFQKRQISEMGFDISNVTTIHNFVDLPSNDYSSNFENYILYYGRIEKVKGIHILLDALKILDSNIKLVIAGTGEYLSELEEKVKEDVKLRSNVSFVGFKSGNELIRLVANSLFVVVPSIWFETFGLTVVEAMSFGKPVIGSNIGGISEIIENGYNGFLTEPENEIDLADKINHLLKDKFVLREMGRSARNTVLTKFSSASHFAKINKLYESLIS